MTGKNGAKAAAAGEYVGYRNQPKSDQFIKGKKSGNQRGPCGTAKDGCPQH